MVVRTPLYVACRHVEAARLVLVARRGRKARVAAHRLLLRRGGRGRRGQTPLPKKWRSARRCGPRRGGRSAAEARRRTSRFECGGARRRWTTGAEVDRRRAEGTQDSAARRAARSTRGRCRRGVDRRVLVIVRYERLLERLARACAAALARLAAEARRAGVASTRRRRRKFEVDRRSSEGRCDAAVHRLRERPRRRGAAVAGQRRGGRSGEKDGRRRCHRPPSEGHVDIGAAVAGRRGGRSGGRSPVGRPAAAGRRREAGCCWKGRENRGSTSAIHRLEPTRRPLLDKGAAVARRGGGWTPLYVAC